MGGSILPVTIYNGRVYLLFGKERDIDENPGWSDFGGGRDKNESHFETAAREGSEELTGFLGSSHELVKRMKKYGVYTIDYQSNGYDKYRCHLFPMKYDVQLPYFYNNNQRFLQKKLDPRIIRDSKLFEKTEIRWFSFPDIAKNKSQFRTFYKNIVDNILNQRAEITSFVKRHLLKTKTRTRTNKSRNRNKKTRTGTGTGTRTRTRKNKKNTIHK